VAKEKDIKGDTEMTEGKNKISVRSVHPFAGGPSDIYAVSERLIKQSRFNGKSDIFV
jgi:hypothetical protein